jgi:hypothetical protein
MEMHADGCGEAGAVEASLYRQTRGEELTWARDGRFNSA